MRFAVESWAPEYGAAVDAVELEPVSASVDIGVECEPDEWAPHQPAIDADPIDSVVFIDGIRRVEARVWLRDAEPGGDPAPAICASYAAGAVRCNALAQVEIARVRRGLFTSASDAEPIDTRHGRFSVVPVPGGDSDQLSLALQGRMGDLEAEVAAEIAGGDDLVCVDGPLKGQWRGAVGYVKTHSRSYGPPVVAETVTRLEVGQRTPVLLIGDPRRRFSWYLRLPGPVDHPWAGVVRCEVAAVGEVDGRTVPGLADRVSRLLPRFASKPHKDSRAPQNLYPIAGLERELRHRLGDPALLYRALRLSAAA